MQGQVRPGSSVRLCGDDRRAEFEAVALPLMPALLGTARWLTGSAADAEDLVQETYLRAFAGFRGFAQGSCIRGWMYTILRRARTDELRRRARRPTTAWQPESEVAITAPQAALASGWETLARGLDRLPACHRAAVVLRIVEDMSYRDIASRLGVPVGTVMSRICRGRRRLRDSLARAAPSSPGPTPHDESEAARLISSRTLRAS